MGRVDDVLNVAGHRLSTMEVESALVSHPKVAEAAVVGRPDDLKGQAIVAFVTPRQGVAADDALAKELREHVAKQIGALARPDEIRFAEALPKTRLGQDHAAAAARHRRGQRRRAATRRRSRIRACSRSSRSRSRKRNKQTSQPGWSTP